MTNHDDQPFTVAFIGYVDPDHATRATRYEDQVLKLLDDHGATLLYRGHRAGGQAESLPLEVQLIRFPHRAGFQRFLDDDRRFDLRQEFGEVFSSTQVVELDMLAGRLREPS